VLKSIAGGAGEGHRCGGQRWKEYIGQRC